MAQLELADIQGLILRGYNMPAVRYFLLRVDNPQGAKEFLHDLTQGDAALCPQVTTAATWQVKPESCVNIGFTFPGLQALGLPANSLASFAQEFAEGAATRAAGLGLTGDSAG